MSRDQDMTDSEFLDYCESHSNTPRSGFVPLSIARLFRLSGDEGTAAVWDETPNQVINANPNHIKLLVQRARERLKDQPTTSPLENRSSVPVAELPVIWRQRLDEPEVLLRMPDGSSATVSDEEAKRFANTILAFFQKEEVLRRLAKLTEEPKCPECGVEVLRPKCVFELGLDCPRHEVIQKHGGHARLSARVKELEAAKQASLTSESTDD